MEFLSNLVKGGKILSPLSPETRVLDRMTVKEDQHKTSIPGAATKLLSSAHPRRRQLWPPLVRPPPRDRLLFCSLETLSRTLFRWFYSPPTSRTDRQSTDCEIPGPLSLNSAHFWHFSGAKGQRTRNLKMFKKMSVRVLD